MSVEIDRGEVLDPHRRVEQQLDRQRGLDHLCFPITRPATCPDLAEDPLRQPQQCLDRSMVVKGAQRFPIARGHPVLGDLELFLHLAELGDHVLRHVEPSGQSWQEIGEIGDLHARCAAVAIEEILQTPRGHFRHQDRPEINESVWSDAALHDCRREQPQLLTPRVDRGGTLRASEVIIAEIEPRRPAKISLDIGLEGRREGAPRQRKGSGPRRDGEALLRPPRNALGGIVPGFCGGAVNLVGIGHDALGHQRLVEEGEHLVVDIARLDARAEA